MVNVEDDDFEEFSVVMDDMVVVAVHDSVFIKAKVAEVPAVDVAVVDVVVVGANVVVDVVDAVVSTDVEVSSHARLRPAGRA